MRSSAIGELLALVLVIGACGSSTLTPGTTGTAGMGGTSGTAGVGGTSGGAGTSGGGTVPSWCPRGPSGGGTSGGGAACPPGVSDCSDSTRSFSESIGPCTLNEALALACQCPQSSCGLDVGVSEGSKYTTVWVNNVDVQTTYVYDKSGAFVAQLYQAAGCPWTCVHGAADLVLSDVTLGANPVDYASLQARCARDAAAQ
jgi:hypothetical protein